MYGMREITVLFDDSYIKESMSNILITHELLVQTIVFNIIVLLLLLLSS